DDLVTGVQTCALPICPFFIRDFPRPKEMYQPAADQDRDPFEQQYRAPVVSESFLMPASQSSLNARKQIIRMSGHGLAAQEGAQKIGRASCRERGGRRV